MSGALSALGKYEIRGTLGKGAMGIVYDGWDPVIVRRVAIKTIDLPDTHDEEAVEGLARFKREAQAAGRLTHPNIVGVYDYGETDALAYIVMEFVEGRSLKEVLTASERMTAMEAVKLMEDVLAGLTYSHERGVVHRDIKPANIMMTRDDRAKIADFGIARIEASSMTQAGAVMGTPAYMSPEQFMGQVVDRRTDIYSCGVMLYQLLTGERPYDGSMTSIMHKATTTVPPAPSELAVTSPIRLDAVVARAMAKRPEDRYDTAADFAAALRAPAATTAFDIDETMVAARKNVPSIVAAKPRSKLPVIVAGGVAAAVIVAGGVWFLLPGATPRVQEASVAPTLSTPPAPAPVVQPPTPVPVSPATPAPVAVNPPRPSQAAPQIPSNTPVIAPRLAPPQQALIVPQPAPSSPQPRAQPPVSPPVTELMTSRPTTPEPVPSTPTPAPAVPQRQAAIPPSPPATALMALRQAAPEPVLSAPAPPPPVPQRQAEAPPSPVSAEPSPPRPAAPTLQASNNPPPVFYSAPAPVQPASTVPDPGPTPSRPVSIIEATLASSLPTVKCSLTRSTTAPDGRVTLTGLSGAGQPEEALRRAATAAGSSGLDWQVRSFSGPYCPVLDVLRPVADFAARNRNAMEMVQAGGPIGLQDNDVIALNVAMPAFAGFLHVAYLDNHGTVSPQVPGPGYPEQTYPARHQIELGKSRQDFDGWHVGPPFGTDMIVAIVSTAPLFAKPLPDSEPLSTYVSALQSAMDGLRRRGGTVAAAAVVIDTRPLP